MGKNSQVNIYPSDWKKRSQFVIYKVSNGECDICGADAKYTVLHCAHAFMPADSGEHDIDFLRCFCPRCHAIWDWSMKLRRRRSVPDNQLNLFSGSQQELFTQVS